MKCAISAIISIGLARTSIYDKYRRPLQRRFVGIPFLIVLLCGFMLAGCSGNKYERALIGEWYEKGDDSRPAIVFLKDGTFEKECFNVIHEEWYTGVGDWSVEEDQLILSSGNNAYVAEIISIDKESAVLRGIDFSWQSYAAIQSEPDNVLQLWKSP